ncbi:MAG: SDR family oxidoreductase [Candidatus Berkelbacteria bacterium]|nr:MAG: SDR family oxidoreductase [Candidatus Berkelbacteria bacterium]QQG51757.1 MAG: SDR family oxidoreductase [Candidatus Berkelbacteria bacterium]
MNELAGKTVLITGASRGIGEVTAYEFAKAGCKLALTYLSKPEEAKLVEDKCRQLGAPKVMFYQLDVTNDDQIHEFVKNTKTDFGSIDVLVNNAGILIWKFFSDMSFDEIDQQVAVNVTGLMKLTNALLPQIQETIINIGSQAGKRAGAEHVAYCATKFAVRGFTQGLAQELPSLKIYAVNPDGINTQMNDWGGRPPEQVAKVIVKAASGGYDLMSGSDIDVWEIADEN